jgi:iron(III) transport system substrate-binding protein
MTISNTLRRARTLIAGAMVVSVGLVAPAMAESLDELVAAAKAEGTFTFYTSSSEATVAILIDAFQKEYPGIKANVLRLPSGALNTRYGNEAASSVYEADLFNSATTDLFDKHQDWWQPLNTDLIPNLNEWPETARTPLYLRASFSEHGLVYNKDMLQNPPQKWEDVLEAQYQGRCLMIDPRTSPTFISFYDLLRVTYGDDFLTKLRDQKCTLAAAGLPASQEVGAGGALIGFPVTVSQVNEPAAMGAPIARVEPSGGSSIPAHGIVQYYGVPVKSSHPNAARLYLNWFISGPAQELECKTGGYSSPNPAAKGCDPVSEKFYPARSDVSAEDRSKVLKLLGLDG